MSGALRIAIVGAESTGKTALAQALAEHLAAHTGLKTTWVPEWLRQWCEHTGRTPLAHEQPAIARAQHERIEAAAAGHQVVVCDTTALMTAVYSRWVFGDRSLEERAAQLHRRMDLTLLTALDLPWVADGLQRDGPQVREPVDSMLRELLQTWRLPFAVVTGQGPARLQAALQALAPLLRQLAEEQQRGSKERGLFSRLGQGRPASAARHWGCQGCDEPGCRPGTGSPTR